MLQCNSFTQLSHDALRVERTVNEQTTHQTWSCAAGRLTSAIISEQGCSTCKRGFSSRKKNDSSSSLYKYSTVPALTYPTILASLTAAWIYTINNTSSDAKTNTHRHQKKLAINYSAANTRIQKLQRLRQLQSKLYCK